MQLLATGPVDAWRPYVNNSDIRTIAVWRCQSGYTVLAFLVVTYFERNRDSFFQAVNNLIFFMVTPCCIKDINPL